jgi:uncharacterized protein YbjT (DUF2867 family)
MARMSDQANTTIPRDGGPRGAAVATAAPILVLGATGKTGARVAARLRERGLQVRAGSRSGSTRFDWEDRATWAPALEGAGAVYVAYYPDLAVPGAAETVGALAAWAAAAGVRRLVLLSGRGEEEAQHAERRVRDAFPAATIVRCSWFAQNFSESFLAEPLLAGELALPVSGVREPFVDADDIADVAVAALTEDQHAGRLYELTGPRLLTFGEAVAEVAAASGRAIRFVSVPAEAWTAGLRAEGLPEDVVWLMGYLFTEVLDGRNEHLTDGVREALGRPPRDFGDYARAAAANGAWAA